MEDNMTDLSKFGYRELAMAGELLTAYAQERNFQSQEDEDTLQDGVRIEFNPNSGYVFLADEDHNVLMLNDEGKLEAWLFCGDCGYENFRSKFKQIDDRHEQSEHEETANEKNNADQN